MRLLRTFNPDVPICGLWTGGLGCHAFPLRGMPWAGLDSFYRPPPRRRWREGDGDLALAEWYRDVGHDIAFDVAHLVERELLFLDSLERIYSSVPDRAVGLTAIAPISAIEHDRERLRGSDGRHQWQRLLSYARAVWAYDGVPHACWRAGACFPRAFLARYAAIEPPDLCHDELRVPLFAQILGFPIADTGFRQWNDPDADGLFNRRGPDIELESIGAELTKADGRRAFHPVGAVFRGWA